MNEAKQLQAGSLPNPSVENGSSYKSDLTDANTGIIFLVGAGCHDVSWLSLQAKELIETCDALVYDDLIDPSIPLLAKKAKKYYRGKRGHKKSADQKEINALLKDLAKTHRCIVRLKGGDPMIFGRGMEEIEALQKAGLEVQLVPGISSFYGLPAKELFGLTKRGEAAGFMVLTAHKAREQRTLDEWRQIAGFEGTRIFLMGMAEIADIAHCLIEAGLDEKTPAAILCSTAMTFTKSVKAPLNRLAEEAKKADLKSPGIILIGGSVQSFAPLQSLKAGFFTSRSCFEKVRRLLPPSIQSALFTDFQYQDKHPDLKTLLEADAKGWLVFSSPYGVTRFFKRLREQKADGRLLAGWKFACIGPGTANELESHGYYADLVPDIFDSEHLLEALRKTARPDEPLLLLQSTKARNTLSKGLKDFYNVSYIPLYDFSVHLLQNPDCDVLVLASLEAARFFKENPVHTKAVLCLSERIASEIRPLCKAKSVPVLLCSSAGAEAIAAGLKKIQKQNEMEPVRD